MVDADPLPEQVLCLLEQTLGVVELPGLQNTRVDVRRGAARGTVREQIVLLVGAQHLDQAGEALGRLSAGNADSEQHLDHVIEIALGDGAVAVINQVQLHQLHAERHGHKVVAVVHGLSQQTVDLCQVDEVRTHQHVHDFKVVADVLATFKQTPETQILIVRLLTCKLFLDLIIKSIVSKIVRSTIIVQKYASKIIVNF